MPDSSLTFLAVRMFSVLMISSKATPLLCPWMKLLVNARKQTRVGISWEVRPINSFLFAVIMQDSKFPRRNYQYHSDKGISIYRYKIAETEGK